MSSEFSCDYCSNHPRNPCYSKEEAATCGNAIRGMHHDFNVRHVIEWLRYRSNGDAEVLKAAQILEDRKYEL